MNGMKQDRVLELFFRGLRGEDLHLAKLANEYGVSVKSISRSVSDLKSFLADHRELVGNAELTYDYQKKCYRLYLEEFLSNMELFTLVEVMIGARALSRMELLALTEKLRKFTTPEDRPLLQELIRKEMYHYPEIKHECESVEDTLWRLVNCIAERREITVAYYKMDRSFVTRRICPASVMFTDYYFYLIAFQAEDKKKDPVYFRVDRIKRIVEHRRSNTPPEKWDFDEGLLRKRSLFMWPGKLRTIRFVFSGPSVQAVLDKLPTAKILERQRGDKYLIEAETYGDGIKMWLLSQGSWVKVLWPEEFADEIKDEIARMLARYQEDGDKRS